MCTVSIGRSVTVTRGFSKEMLVITHTIHATDILQTLRMQD